jgi:hypothetical protein
MNAREQRGLAIAATCPIKREGQTWRVPSQSGNGHAYRVNPKHELCTCPDRIETGEVCKHLHAVRFVMKRERNTDGTVTVTEELTLTRKTTYGQDWAKYNAAQVNELKHFQAFLADLCGSLPTPAPRRGQQPIKPSDAAFCAILKTYSTMSARRFMGDLADSKDNGYVSRVPHFNSVLNFLDTEAATPILLDFIERSAAPLVAVESTFAVDSTGFAGARYARWFDERYGVPRSEIQWLKLHAMVGVKTNVITSCKVTGKDGADSPQLPELVQQSANQFAVQTVVADKAYAGEKNFTAINGVGGEFYPAFRDNTTGGVGGAFQKAFHLMSANKDAYMNTYHARSNVESTFSALKRKFGEALRSKNELSMKNEILAKVVCYNITCVIQEMYTLGIDPSFVVKPRCTTNAVPAHQLN